ADLLEGQGLGVARELRHAIEDEQDGRAPRVAVLVTGDLVSDLSGDAEFLGQLALEGLTRRFPGLDLAAGELPLERVRVAGLALANQDETVALYNTGNHQKRTGHWYKDTRIAGEVGGISGSRRGREDCRDNRN